MNRADACSGVEYTMVMMSSNLPSNTLRLAAVSRIAIIILLHVSNGHMHSNEKTKHCIDTDP